MRYCFKPTGMAKSENKRERKKIVNVGEDVEKLDPSCTDGRNVKWCIHFGEQSATSSSGPQFKKNENICLHICTWMFTTALFIVVKRWKNPNVHQLMNE